MMQRKRRACCSRFDIAVSDDDINPESDKFGGHGISLLPVADRVPPFDSEIAPFDVAKFRKAIHKALTQRPPAC